MGKGTIIEWGYIIYIFTMKKYTHQYVHVFQIYMHTHCAPICVNKKRYPMNSVNKKTWVFNCKNLHLHDFSWHVN